MSTQEAATEAIRRSVTVDCSVEHAFATFTERIFGWHGMGELFVESITKSDVNTVAGVTLLVAVLVLVAGFLSDLVYAALDPRVRV